MPSPQPRPNRPHTKPIVARRATPADAREAAHIIIGSRAANTDVIPPMAHPPRDVVDWFTNYVMPNQTVWLATYEDQSIGTLVLTPGWIEQLYLLPDFANLGAGSQLVDLAKEQSDGILELWTFASNLGAIRFYLRHGFVEQERTDGDNEEGAPDIRFRWTRPDAT